MGACGQALYAPGIELLHFVLFQFSAGDLLQPDFTFRAKDTLYQLAGAHFKAEESDRCRLGSMECGIPGEVEGKSGFTYGRTCGENDQIGGLPSVSDPVE